MLPTALTVLLAACSPNSEAVLIQACVQDNEPRLECECNVKALTTHLPSGAVKSMANAIAKKDRRALNTAFSDIEDAYPSKTKQVMIDMAACEGPSARVRNWPSSGTQDEPRLQQ